MLDESSPQGATVRLQNNTSNKSELYASLAKQIRGLVDPPSEGVLPHMNTTISLGNVAALLFYELNRHQDPAAMLQSPPINWLGFYLLQSPRLLVLGPFQGRPACTTIKVGHGVCGTALERHETLIVSNVHTFVGHIACDGASESEIVVPIKTVDGHVIGALDIDSTQLNFFDAVDADGLEQIAAILAQHLEFPLSHSPTVSLEQGLAVHPTCVTLTDARLNALGEPQQRSAEVGGWLFTATTFTRILTQEELQQYETKLGISTMPEIQFPFNTLCIAPAAIRGGAPLITFSLLEILRSAAAFYRTDVYRLTVAPQLKIPVAESWKQTPYAVFDPKVDWAWRNNYFGVDEQRCTLQPLPCTMAGVNWELLKDVTLPILFFHEFDMMEDDIHDNGIVKSSIRVRVMKTAFFILYRHFIRVDGYCVWIRDVRLFHEYAVKREDGQPHIVIREELRTLDISNRKEWRELGPNECAQEANLVDGRDYFLNFNDPADHSWWGSIGAE